MLCDTTELLRHNRAAVIQVQKRKEKKKEGKREKGRKREKGKRKKRKERKKMRIESYGLCCTGT